MKKNMKIYPSMFMIVGLIIMQLLGYGLFAFIVINGKMYDNMPDDLLLFGFVFFLVFLPLLIFVMSIHRIFALVRINEEGISISLFKKFKKRKVSWEEIKDIRVYNRLWIVVSKENNKEKKFHEVTQNKENILIGYSEKIYTNLLYIRDLNKKPDSSEESSS